jgi:DNA segregation ATPase FtsK/SpoIIIE-like protein
MSARKFSYLDIGEIVDADTDETVLILASPDDEFGEYLEKTLNGYATIEEANEQVLSALRARVRELEEANARLKEAARAGLRYVGSSDAYITELEEAISRETHLSEEDDLYERAVSAVVKAQKASTSYVQRMLGINYNTAMRLMHRMTADGIVSRPNSAGKRECLSAALKDAKP